MYPGTSWILQKPKQRKLHNQLHKQNEKMKRNATSKSRNLLKLIWEILDFLIKRCWIFPWRPTTECMVKYHWCFSFGHKATGCSSVPERDLDKPFDCKTNGKMNVRIKVKTDFLKEISHTDLTKPKKNKKNNYRINYTKRKRIEKMKWNATYWLCWWNIGSSSTWLW